MEWIEIGEAAEGCKNCAQMDCYNCDTAGERWVLSVEDELKTRRKLMVRAVERLQRQIAEIDAQLEKCANKNRSRNEGGFLPPSLREVSER